MTPVLVDITEPIPSVLGDSGHPTGVLLSPVFVEGGARRRRLLARWGYLATAACLTYLVMLGVSITASPVSKPGNATTPAPSLTGAGVQTLAPRPARAVPATRALVDGDAAQDTAPVLRLALPVTTRPAPPKPPGATRPISTSRPHHDDDNPPATHPPEISTTPVASSRTASPKPTPASAAR